MNSALAEAALHVPTLLLPKPGVPLASWAVIACDQHTSSPEYWRETERLVGDNPSTLRLILPEAQLGDGDREAANRAIKQRMADYLADGVLVARTPGFMLIERETGRSSPRRGLLVGLDLEAYDYRDGAKTLIRGTEGTDPARLPARVAVRQDAPLETPHTLVLIDDPKRTVIEPLFAAEREPAYDFALMQGGGRVRGWPVADGESVRAAAGALARLAQGDPPLLYALGDGNHSFAAARTVWESLKAAGAPAAHPARWALAELVNIHDDGLEFAPIHRLLETGAGAAGALNALDALARHYQHARCARRPAASDEHWERYRRVAAQEPGHHIAYRTAGEQGVFSIPAPPHTLATATLQAFLDEYTRLHSAAKVDYIHGDDTLIALARRQGCVGFFLPTLHKRQLFETVLREGATPRKTFSLGEAHEKRYYLECRRIHRA